MKNFYFLVGYKVQITDSHKHQLINATGTILSTKLTIGESSFYIVLLDVPLTYDVSKAMLINADCLLHIK